MKLDDMARGDLCCQLTKFIQLMSVLLNGLC